MTQVVKRLGQRTLPWLVPVVLVIFWQVASVTGWLNSKNRRKIHCYTYI